MKFNWMVLLLFLTTGVYGQENLLKRKVDLDFDQQSIQKALFEISEKANFTFSYDASIFDDFQNVTLITKRESIKNVLREILPKNIEYKVSGNHLILLRVPDTGTKNRKYIISGNVYSAKDKKPLNNIVVYEVSSLVSDVTNEKGEFSIEVPSEFEQLGLSFNQKDVEDTIVLIVPKDQKLSIYLKPKKPLLYAKSISNIDYTKPVETLPIVSRLVSNQSLLRTENSKIVLHRPAQVSFLPKWGTNLKMSGLVKNKLSFNVLIGYSYGVGMFEIGGLFNVVSNEVDGSQIAGLGNLVGGNVDGVQIGGLFNHNRGTMDGVQIGGISNVLIDSLKGVQISGISNVLKGGMKGWQIAGVNNLTTRNVDGGQIAGVSNVTKGDVKKFQLAGLINSSKNVSGVQIAGLLNSANGEVKGFQISGLGNYASQSISGYQISALFNYTKYSEGRQISFLNFADSVSGTPIGFLSYVKKGLHVVELSTNDITAANVTFKTGVKIFYNIFSAGYTNWTGKERSSFGYGLGTERTLGRKTYLNVEYSAHWVNEEKKIQKDLSLLNRLGINFGYRMKGIGFTIGPILNIWLTEWRNKDTGEYLSKLAPSGTSAKTIGTAQMQTWLGGQFAIQF